MYICIYMHNISNDNNNNDKNNNNSNNNSNNIYIYIIKMKKLSSDITPIPNLTSQEAGCCLGSRQVAWSHPSFRLWLSWYVLVAV